MKHLFVKTAIVFAAVVLITACVAEKASAEWNEGTKKKYENLVNIGMPKDVANSLLTHCKALATDQAHCVKIGASILGAESSLGTRCHRNNCVGMNDWAVGFKSKDDWIKHWVEKYAKYWYKQSNPSGFYSGTPGIIPKTHYCMGKKKDGYCPEGSKNSWKTFNSLTW